jgi:adenylylsulfate kinase
VPDREVAFERCEPALVENLRNQAHVLDDGDRLAVAHRDACRLLPAVLQRVEPEEGEVCDGLPGAVYAEDAACVSGSRSVSVQEGPSYPARMEILGCCLWFTGLSGAGKSTIANIVVDELRARGRKVELLDGDEVREHLSKGLGFSKEDRDTNIRRIGWVAAVLARNGVVSVTAAISPYRAVREEVRAMVDNFVEIYVATSLEDCEARDVKGLYAKARAGEIPEFTGVSDPYEPPESPEIRLETSGCTPKESAAEVVAWLESHGLA